MLVKVDEQQRFAQRAPGQKFELLKTSAFAGAAFVQRLAPIADGVAQIAQCALVGCELEQRVPGRPEARQKQLLLARNAPQGGHALRDECGVGAGAACAHRLVDLLGQRPEAVTQLARVFIGHTLAQKPADIAEGLERQQLTGARGRHGVSHFARRGL